MEDYSKYTIDELKNSYESVIALQEINDIILKHILNELNTRSDDSVENIRSIFYRCGCNDIIVKPSPEFFNVELGRNNISEPIKLMDINMLMDSYGFKILYNTIEVYKDKIILEVMCSE